MNRSNLSLPILGLAGILAAGPLLAQQPGAGQPENRANPLFWVNGASGLPVIREHFTFGQSLSGQHAEAVRPPLKSAFELDGESFEIEVSGKGVEIQADGELLAEDRLQAVLAPGSKVPHTVWIRDRDQQTAVAIRLAPDSVTVRFLPRSKKAWLGVDVRPLGAALAGHLDLDADGHALVVAVRPDSPAARAGLEEHDVLVAIDGTGPVTHERLGEELASRAPGDSLELEVVRRGERLEVLVELGRAPVLTFGAAWSPSMFEAAAQNDLYLRPGAAGEARVFLDPQGRLVRETARDRFPAASSGSEARDSSDAVSGTTSPGAGKDQEDLATRIERIESTLLQLEKLLERLEKRKKDA